MMHEGGEGWLFLMTFWNWEKLRSVKVHELSFTTKAIFCILLQSIYDCEQSIEMERQHIGSKGNTVVKRRKIKNV